MSCASAEGVEHQRLPWLVWPLVPLLLPVVFVFVLLPLVGLCVLAAPLISLYPDRVRHLYDLQGTPHQRERLAQWRAVHRRLGLWGRFWRANRRGVRWYRNRRTRPISKRK